MAQVKDIAKVIINIGGSVAQRPSFGKALILFDDSPAVTYKEYFGIDDVVLDFAAGTEIHTAGLRYFSQTPSPEVLAVGDRPTGTVTAALDAIRAVNDSWYLGLELGRVQSDQEEFANYIEPLDKIAILDSADADIFDGGSTTDVAFVLQALNLQRTAIFYHDVVAQQPAAAWAGRGLARDPGTQTWATMELVGITGTVLTSGQEQAIKDKSANFYAPINNLGLNNTFDGTMAGGQFIDVIRAADFMESEIGIDIVQARSDANKIPYETIGITQIESIVNNALQRFEDAVILAKDPKFTVGVPAIENVVPADKLARKLKNVTFGATFSGAIHNVDVEGNVAA